MKEHDIQAKYNISIPEFRVYLLHNRLPFTDSMFGGLTVDDNQIDVYVGNFLLEQKEKEREEAEAKIREAIKQKAMSEMLITSGFSFDGYTITKYSGYISGDDAISVERGTVVLGAGKNVADELMGSLVTIRRNALRELKEAAYALGCNAVIGVDFDYLTLDPQTASLTGGTVYQPYVFGVTANGNAVIIEKNKD